MRLPFELETDLERAIAADPEWQEGARWGRPRPGHPEGAVANHVADVLENVEREALDEEDRAALRLIALLHDAFKYRVDRRRPRTGENHHGGIARRFAERYVDDAELLEIVELHDEAYNAWRKGARGDWSAAEARAARLIERLGPSLPRYLRFYRADNATGSKTREPVEWFERLARARRDCG